MNELIDALLDAAQEIRYVAVYRDGELATRSRPGLGNASASESDRYEELLVNPALLTLTTQRGNIDCGGLRFLLVRYGHFFQYVAPLPGGHMSVSIEADADPLRVAGKIAAVVRRIAGERE
jgi:hypothetical protein